METSKFLKRVLGDVGPYCVLAIRDGSRNQRFFDTVEEVINYANEVDEDGADAYFALGSFKSKASREAVNVRSLRSFYIDIDCRPEKDQNKNYGTKKEGLAALKGFCETVGLPRPFMVDSGGGVHAYWFLTEEVSTGEWLPVAKKLKALCKKHKFKIDMAVPADAARVLRVPGTKNYKDDPPSTVSFLGLSLTSPITLEQFDSILGDEIEVSGTEALKGAMRGSDALTESHVSNLESHFKIILDKTAKGRGCKQLKHIIKNQKDVEEPLWRAGLSIAKFCVDADKAAHLISHKHPGYSPDETQEKLNRIAGPYTCSTFADLNEKGCEDCSHRGSITSPILLGKRVREATDEDNTVTAKSGNTSQDSVQTYKIPQYPKPYFRGANGGIYLRSVSPDGDPEEKVVYHNDLYVVKRVRDVEQGESIVMRLHLPKDGVREFTVPLTAVTSRDEFRKALSAQGVAVVRMDEIMSYAMSWINNLQATQTASMAHTQFGWTDNYGTSFVLGDSEIFADKAEFNPPSSKTAALMDVFTPSGSLEEWKKAMGFYNRPGFEVHQFAIGIGFGSILMQFSPLMSAAFHMYSKDSGVGKTTALKAALSIWGNPEELMLTDQDTLNTKMNRGEVYHNLPLCIDEMTNTSGAELSNFAYQTTGGKQRGRMKGSSNTERHRGRAWKLLALTTGNTSIVERISAYKAMPKAEAQRILEYNMPVIAFSSKRETDVLSHQLSNNYGWAGKIFVTYCLNNIAQVKDIAVEVQRKLDERAHLTAQNRFWSETISKGIVGCLLAKKLGLVDFNTKRLFDWAVNDLLQENKGNITNLSSDPQTILNDYIYENWSNILWIKSSQRASSKAENNNGLDSLVVADQMPRNKLVARYEPDTCKLFLLPKPFKEWCTRQQHNYASLRATLIQEMDGMIDRVRIDRGTKMSLPPAHVLILHTKIDEKVG